MLIPCSNVLGFYVGFHVVYQSRCWWCRHDQGFKVTAKFGQKYEASPKKGKKGRLPVNLLYTGGNHFDLLVGNP